MSPSYRVLLTDYPWEELDIERRILAAAGAELIAAPSADEATLVEQARGVDAILTCWGRVTAAVLDAAPRCRVVSRMGIGLDNIDVAGCSQRGIMVTNVPDYCVTEVAEHALALILALGRRVALFHQATKAGRYDLRGAPPPRRLAGQTLGIIGWGNIGRCLADKAQALGLRIAVHSRRPPTGSSVQALDLFDLLRSSDYVSLHVPLTPATQGMIGAEQLRQIKPTAFLINTARGGLVDHDALAEALAENRIAGAGLDVQTPEPPDLNRAPYNDPRVIVTPHCAFVSEESLIDLRTRAATQVATVLHGGRPEHVVSPPLSSRSAT